MRCRAKNIDGEVTTGVARTRNKGGLKFVGGEKLNQMLGGFWEKKKNYQQGRALFLVFRSLGKLSPIRAKPFARGGWENVFGQAPPKKKKKKCKKKGGGYRCSNGLLGSPFLVHQKEAKPKGGK